MKYPTCGYWYTCGTDNTQWSHSDILSFDVKCVVTDAASREVTSNTVEVYVGMAKKQGEKEPVTVVPLPTAFGLQEPYPNPFNPTTNIVVDLPQAGHVRLAIYDILGREIATLMNQSNGAGRYVVPWNAANVGSGVYLARVNVLGEAGQQLYTGVKRLMVVK
jgi:hypothetical protein